MVIIVIHSIQKWLPFEKILENGIIKLKNNSYIMILKIKPINYNLKSNLEKESILNSYKLFLKSFNFNIQIIIKSQKQDLSNHIIKIINSQKKESQIIKNISKNTWVWSDSIVYVKDVKGGNDLWKRVKRH